MKILILSSINGDVDIVNEYIDKSKCDAVLCAGDFGIFYQFDETKNLPKKISKRLGNFYEYLAGYKKFKVPVYTVYGAHENHSLVRRILNKDLSVDNFTIIDSGEVADLNGIKIGGLGGTFSPICYNEQRLSGYKRRHFTISQVNKLKENNCDIILTHDLIGQCQAKKIIFSEETYSLFDACRPKYCFVGKYNWLGYKKISIVDSNNSLDDMVVVMTDKANNSYLILDTDTWDAESISPSIFKIKENN